MELVYCNVSQRARNNTIGFSGLICIARLVRFSDELTLGVPPLSEARRYFHHIERLHFAL